MANKHAEAALKRLADMLGIVRADLSLSQDVGKQVFGNLPWKFSFYGINGARKQYSLLDTIFNYIIDFGPPGKHP